MKIECGCIYKADGGKTTKHDGDERFGVLVHPCPEHAGKSKPRRIWEAADGTLHENPTLAQRFGHTLVSGGEEAGRKFAQPFPGSCAIYTEATK